MATDSSQSKDTPAIKTTSPFRLARTGTLAGSIAAMLATQAATFYWDGTGTGWDAVGSWDTAVDGTGGDPVLVPVSADLASFSIITINSLAGAVTIGSARAGQNVAITLGGAQTWTNNSANVLTIQNGINANSMDLAVAGPATQLWSAQSLTELH
jgi:hypothetical protein